MTEKFFDSVREDLFGGKLTQSQVNGMNGIFDAFERFKFTDKRWLAYMLGTAYHETAKTMMPIEEYGKGKNYDYGKKLKRGRGKDSRVPYETPDKLYYGRGHVQLTWYENYELLGKLLNIDLLNKPELALDPYISGEIMAKGMSSGLFTGKKLSDYFNSKGSDWVNARRIINGMDKADKIATEAKLFHKALTA